VLGVLTVADLMREFAYSETSIRELIRDHGLPTVRLLKGGDVRFLADDVRGWLRGLSKLPEASAEDAWPRRPVAVRSRKRRTSVPSLISG
jgi:predicted DNA-binding transcriptional regulator AlpA